MDTLRATSMRLSALMATSLVGLLLTYSIAAHSSSEQEFGVVLAPEQVEIARKVKADLASKGYVELLDEPRPTDYVQARMEERRGAAREKGFPDDPVEQGFYDLSISPNIDYSTLPFRPTMLNSRHLSARSKSYLLLGTPMLTQLHSDTPYGTILIEQMANTTSSGGRPPNIQIAGVPATFTSVLYEGRKWASVIIVQFGESNFVIQCDQKLEGDHKANFIAMADDLVASSVK